MAINDPSTLKVYSLTVAQNTPFGGAHLLSFAPKVAQFAQIWNQGEDMIQVRINGDPEATFHLDAGNIQVYNWGDIIITSIDFQQLTVSGGGIHDCFVEVQVGLING